MLLFILSFLVSSAFANTPPQNGPPWQDVYQTLPQQLHETMVVCPEKIWPGYSWENVSVLLLEKDHPALVWTAKDNLVTAVPEQNVPVSAYQGVYHFLPWENTKGIAVYPSDVEVFKEENKLLGLILHEGFHNIGQQGWKKTQNKRGTTIPLEATPRIYRRMLFNNLKKYFLDPLNNKEHLNKAFYWHQKWLSQFPQESLAVTDIGEGTARYVEELATIYAIHSCNTSDKEVLAHLHNLVNNDPTYNIKGPIFSLDSEGYFTGSLAAFILEFVHHSPQWQQEAAQGTSVLDMVFRGVSAISENVDPHLKSTHEQAAKKMNDEIDAMLGTSLENYKNKKYVRIGLNGQSASFSPKGFYLPKSLPNTTAIPLRENLTYNAPTTSITVARDTVLFSGPTPCPAAFVALIPEDQLSVTDNMASFHSHGLSGTLKGSFQTDSEGFRYFCGEGRK